MISYRQIVQKYYSSVVKIKKDEGNKYFVKADPLLSDQPSGDRAQLSGHQGIDIVLSKTL